MDPRPWRLLTPVAIALVITTGCNRNRQAAPPPGPDAPEVSPTDPPAVAPVAPMPPSPSPRPSPGPDTRPAPATRPATAPVAATLPSPTTRPAGNPEEIRSVREQFTEAFEQLELFRREVAELHLDESERREVKALFDDAASAWAPVEAELDAGRLPPPDRRTALARAARETESKVKTLIGPEGSIRLAAYRQTPRGGGQRFVSRLRVALRTLHGNGGALTAEQTRRVQSVLEHLRNSVEKLPAHDAPTFEAEQAVRQQVQAVIEETRENLGAVLTPAQMEQVTRQVPSVAKPGPVTRRRDE